MTTREMIDFLENNRNDILAVELDVLPLKLNNNAISLKMSIDDVITSSLNLIQQNIEDGEEFRLFKTYADDHIRYYLTIITYLKELFEEVVL